jgi:hypothetical protein
MTMARKRGNKEQGVSNQDNPMTMDSNNGYGQVAFAFVFLTVVYQLCH